MMPEIWRNVLKNWNKSQDDVDRICVLRPVIYIATKAEILIDCFRRRVVQFRITMSASYDTRR